MAEQKFTKDVDYGNNKNDYQAESELMVTITLSEYRDLVSSDAQKKAAIDEANSNKYEREAENKRLSNENAELKAELYELKKKIDILDTPFEILEDNNEED